MSQKRVFQKLDEMNLEDIKNNTSNVGISFYYIVTAFHNNPDSTILVGIQATEGRGGMWEYARKLALEFEQIHKDRVWDGEFFDVMEEFLETKI